VLVIGDDASELGGVADAGVLPRLSEIVRSMKCCFVRLAVRKKKPVWTFARYIQRHDKGDRGRTWGNVLPK